MAELCAELSEYFDRLRAIMKMFREGIAQVVRRAVHIAIEHWRAKQGRVHKIKMMVPQHLRGNPICFDPWYRGRRRA